MRDVPRTAVYTAYDNSGRILLQLRDGGAPVYPHHWGFFGGHAEEGEGLREAMERELMEELGLQTAGALYLGTYFFDERITGVFAGPLVDDIERLRSGQTEGADLGLFFPYETEGILVSRSDRHLVYAIESWLRNLSGS